MWTLSGFADEIAPDLEEQCTVLDDLNIKYIEFRSAWGTNVLDLDDSQLATVAKVLESHGIEMSSVGSPIGKIGVHDDFDAHLVRFERALQVAERFNAPFIRLFSFFIPQGESPDNHRDEVIRRMAALANLAKNRNVVLLHENEKEIYGDTPSRCLDIVESVGSDKLRLAWDAANFVQCGVRPFSEGYSILRPYTDYIQIKDAVLDTGAVVPAGEGDGQLPETMRALKSDGFDGFFSMEPHLAGGETFGGFSGPDLFRRATHAFTGILKAEGIEYR